MHYSRTPFEVYAECNRSNGEMIEDDGVIIQTSESSCTNYEDVEPSRLHVRTEICRFETNTGR